MFGFRRQAYLGFTVSKAIGTFFNRSKTIKRLDNCGKTFFSKFGNLKVHTYSDDGACV